MKHTLGSHLRDSEIVGWANRLTAFGQNAPLAGKAITLSGPVAAGPSVT